MMAVQLPEPDYYTLAEVAERWEVSEDMLLRLGREDKLSLGTLVTGWLGAWGEVCAPTLGLLGAMGFGADPSRYVACYPVSPRDMPGVFLLDPDKNIVSVGDKVVLHPQSLVDGIGTRFYPWPPRSLPKPYFILADQPFPIGDIIIPTIEIHRIERKQEKADQAIAKAEAESPIPSQSKRALNTRAKVIGALLKSHNINLADKGATSALITKLELQGVALDRDTVKTILNEAREQIEKPN